MPAAVVSQPWCGLSGLGRGTCCMYWENWTARSLASFIPTGAVGREQCWLLSRQVWTWRSRSLMSVSLRQVAPEGSVIWWLIGVRAMAAGEHERRRDQANKQQIGRAHV